MTKTWILGAALTLGLLWNPCRAQDVPDWNEMRRQMRSLQEQMPQVGAETVFAATGELANIGNHVARVALCGYYLDPDSPGYDPNVGEPLARDVARLLEEIADQGDADAQYYLGQLYVTGWGVGQDRSRALALFRRSADAGSAHAQVELGKWYIRGIEVEKDRAMADRYLGQALRSDDPDVCFNVGVCYADPLFLVIVEDVEKAVEAYARAADLGHALSAECLADLYEKGEHVPADPAEARRWRRRAAELGRPAEGDAEPGGEAEEASPPPPSEPPPSIPPPTSPEPAGMPPMPN